MSHYTVGVIIKEKDIKNLEKTENMVFEDAVIRLVSDAMEPFDENMPGEPVLAMTLKELQEKLDEIKNYEGEEEFYLNIKEKYQNFTLQEFCEIYYAYTFREDGAYSTYNENSKWDWYVIGGRWNGCLPIKGEEQCSEERSSYDDDVPNNCCKIKDIELRREATEKEIAEMKEQYEKITTEGNWYKPEYYKKKYPTFEDYMDSQLEFATYALLLSNGEWVEPGEMGWFGMSAATPEEEAKFANTFKQKLNEENPEDYFVLVDCHI